MFRMGRTYIHFILATIKILFFLIQEIIAFLKFLKSILHIIRNIVLFTILQLKKHYPSASLCSMSTADAFALFDSLTLLVSD